MENKNCKSIIKEHGLVLIIFVVLTLVLTYPVVTHLTNHAAGDGGDGFQFKWTIWHVQQVLIGGGGMAGLYYTDYLYYPHGTSLAFETLSLTNTLFLAFPLTLITDNLVLIYNLLFLFNFIAAGYAMYLLIKYLVKDKTVAFLTGFAYTFAPLHMAWGLGYLSLMSFPWIPLFFLFFFKMFEEPNLRNSVIAAIFLFFLALTCWQYLLFAFLIAIPYFIYKLITARRLFTKHFFVRSAILLVLFVVIIWPFASPLISEYFGEEKYYITGFHTAIGPLDYLSPNKFHPIWGERAAISAEGVVFLGYLVILISLLYLIITKKHFFWFLLAAFFFFLSLAPHFEAATSFFKSVPVFQPLYHMGRFSFGVLFSFLILFAYGLKHFLPIVEQSINKKLSFSRRVIKILLSGAIFIILITEYLAIPYPTTYKYRRAEVGFAGEIGQILRGPHQSFIQDFNILVLPPYLGINPFILTPTVYWQTFHEKKMIGGFIPRANFTSRQSLMELRDIIITDNAIAFREFLKKHKVGYIILHTAADERLIYKNIMSLLEKIPIKQVARYRHIYILQVFPELISEKD